MLHSFSISSVKGMEPYMDRNIEILRAKISALAEQDETFDLKKLLQFYVRRPRRARLQPLLRGPDLGRRVPHPARRAAHPPRLEHRRLAFDDGDAEEMAARGPD